MANSAMPFAVLAKRPAGPSGPIRACREREATSTPQMIFVTVTYLVCAIGSQATVRSCVTAAAVPKAPPRLFNRRDHGRRPPRGGVRCLGPLAATFHHSLPPLYRYKGPAPPSRRVSLASPSRDSIVMCCSCCRCKHGEGSRFHPSILLTHGFNSSGSRPSAAEQIPPPQNPRRSG